MATKNDTLNFNGSAASVHPKDSATSVPIGIDYPHHEIHSGTHFFLVSGANIATSGNYQTYFLQTPNDGSLCHMLLNLVTNGECLFQMVEGATNEVTPDLVPRNNRRGSANTSDARGIVSNAAATGGSDLFDAALRLGKSGSGPFGFSSGGAAGNSQEIILAANTVYAFEVQSQEDDVDINWILEWYEHTDKDR